MGKSHWWGAPDLPVDMPYPYVVENAGTDDEYADPLTFICQIRLADIAPFDMQRLLPQTGMLYFFATIDYFLGDFDAPMGDIAHNYNGERVRVLYVPDGVPLQPYEICWEGTDESIFRPAEKMEFRQDTAVSGDGHRLLAMPYQDEVCDNYPGHVCLLQVDEDDRWHLRFHDCGMLFFLIDRKKLQEGQWDEVKTEIFTY